MPPRGSSSCSSLNSGRGGGNVGRLGLFRSRSGLGGLLGGLVLSRLLLGLVLSGLVLGDGLRLHLRLGGGLLLLLGLHSLAGLAEETAELVLGLALAVSGLVVRALFLLLHAKGAEERGATALVLGGSGGLSSRGFGRRGVLDGGTLSLSHALRLNGLNGGLLDRVVELGSSAGDTGLGGSSGLLLGLLLSRAGDLVEEVAEEGRALRLGVGRSISLLLLLVILLFFLLLLILLFLLLSFGRSG